jgi:putative heme-binding domain-containing protein
MQRLTRAELADALVYPSKQVADRFKAFVIEVKGGEPITGFITDQADDTVTIADREQVHRVARSQISSIAPQATSLMPERLLNQLNLDEVRDLLAFLEQNPSVPQTAK